jgi:hypothetical protein
MGAPNNPLLSRIILSIDAMVVNQLEKELVIMNGFRQIKYP